MPQPATPDSATQRQRALSRWDNEGGANESAAHAVRAGAPVMTNTELVHLHIRVIALENILIAVLAAGTERQLEVAREVTTLILPRPGAVAHPLTIQAAKHITDLVDRAVSFQATESS